MTDRFTLAGGATTVPGTVWNDNIVFLLPKYTLVNSGQTSVALGAMLGFQPFNHDAGEDVEGFGEEEAWGAGLLYAVGTRGTKDWNFSLGLGWGFSDGEAASTPGVMLGGQARVNRRISLISENWFASGGGGTGGVVSYGLRFLGEGIER